MAPTVGDDLEHDHREIDEQFARFVASLESNDIDREALAAGAHGLRHHIWVEETLHFPPVRAAGLLAPVLVMLREHGEIWRLLENLENAVSRDFPREGITRVWQTLEEVLDAHNSKEEQILYPTGDQVLSPEQNDAVRAALADGTMPEGWRCQMAG